MGEILAYAAAGSEYIVKTRVHIRPCLLVIELVTDPGHDSRDVDRDVFSIARPRHPEQILQPLAEGNVPARIQKFAIVFDVSFILSEKITEHYFRGQLVGARFQHRLGPLD